ncbi:zonular occludens toxin domain-containing protein, partial [Vibrio metoecus]|uniref:zonular occludens toxin domain-containing protein n=1 Tax=Vibrio metoecus TaxID=1481663 RepID=UPI001C3EF937
MFNEALSVLNLEEEQLTGDIIKSLGLSWHRFDNPTKIHELPSGSVILADEVQNIWPTRQSSKDPTPDVQFVSTHRHNAQNLVYVSQDFRDVDQFIRRRIAHYTHFEFLGGEWLNRFHSNNLFDPSSKADLVRVGSEKVRRDNKYYGLYLSSIDHTQKVGLSASMKKALKLGAFALVMLLAGVIGLFQTPLFASFLWGDETEVAEKTETSTSPTNTSEPQPVNKQQSFNGY